MVTSEGTTDSTGRFQDLMALKRMSAARVTPMDETVSSKRPVFSLESNSSEVDNASNMSRFRTVIVVSILFVINLLNYMDRYTIAGILTDVQDYYSKNDAWGGAIQTVFMIFFMIFSPMFGFIGDRYNRKWIFVVGIAIWVAAVFCSSLVPSEMAWLFLLMRGVVGIGEASYAIISPTVIADMFTGVTRSRMLMFFYFAIPLGCGLGFILGAVMNSLTGHWQWGVRVTVFLGIICLILIIFFVTEPERGKAEREKGEIVAQLEKSSYLDDMKYLVLNKTYVLSSLGYTATVFMVGTLAWWVPSAILYADAHKKGRNSTSGMEDDSAHINLVFGSITCIGGIAGVAIGTSVSTMWSGGKGPFKYIQTIRADAIVCALGALIALPSLLIAMHTIDNESMTVCWIMLFITVTASSFNWATNVDLLLTVVVPQRRSSASSWQILVSHLFGDATGPYIIGLISDAIRGDDDTPKGHYEALIQSFYLCAAFLCLSTVLFIASAFTVVADKRRFQEAMLTSKSTTIEKEEPEGSETAESE